jgi:hypothetical protein
MTLFASNASNIKELTIPVPLHAKPKERQWFRKVNQLQVMQEIRLFLAERVVKSLARATPAACTAASTARCRTSAVVDRIVMLFVRHHQHA